MANQPPVQSTIEAFLSLLRVLKSKLSYKNPLMHLPLVQMQTMKFVQEHGQVTMKNVAEFLIITPPSATALVDNLVKLKYIHRFADKKDRRTIHLKLTATGLKILKKAVSEHSRRLQNILRKLNSREQKLFIKLLSKMVN